MTMDNSKRRLHDVFFYGLYMDPDILNQKAVEPRNPRLGMVTDYVLRIGNKATLIRAGGESAYGLVYSLTHDEVYLLYWGSGLAEYRVKAVLVQIDGKDVVAMTCNLLNAPERDESNMEYAGKLKLAMTRLGVPVIFD